MNIETESRYFDSAATTPVDPAVLEAMLPYLSQSYGNPNSLHSWGRNAHEAVNKARSQVADLIGAEDPSQIYFTSGATEANNWVVHGFANGIASPFEHSSLRNPATLLGWQTLNSDFSLPRDATDPEVASVMTVNNETGTIWDVRGLPVSATYLHSDATQAIGKIPFTVEGLSFVSMSAHKLYGPKGVGALYCEREVPPPLLIGGEQENGARSGTLNVPAIVGFGAAAELAMGSLEENHRKAERLRSIFLEEISQVSDYLILGGPKTSPFILSLSFIGVEGESLVVEADRAGFAISSGAACSAGSTEPSHVLVALGVEAKVVRGAVRISFNKYNDADSTRGLARCLVHSLEKLRTFSMGRETLRNAE